jgi:large subunit ribosomal protein L24
MIEKDIPVKSKIRKGDLVMVTTGSEKNKTGKVLRVISKGKRAIIEKLNMVKKHVKPSQTSPSGGIVEKEAPIQISNINMFCSKCNKAVRVGIKQNGNKKVRFCKKCKHEF